MQVEIRRAAASDIHEIFRLGQSSEAFRVSKEIPFYEFDEVQAWLSTPGENIFLIAEWESEVVGFLFCKIMSLHWALLDNFYVAPAFRSAGVATAMFGFLRDLLSKVQIKYLSSLVDETNEELQAWFKGSGLKTQRRYVWMDTFLD